jgi:hypothetical protein
VTAFGQDEAALAKLRGAHGDTVRTGMLDGMMEIEAWRMSRAAQPAFLVVRFRRKRPPI